MARLIKRTRNNYTNVSNVLARDKRLTWKARGIFLYMWSQADNWQFYVSEVAKHAADGRESLQNGLKELEKFGYLTRTNRQNDGGKFSGMEWILSDVPNRQTGKTVNGENSKKEDKNAENPSDGKTVQRGNDPTGNPSLRNNNNKNYQHKETTTVSNKHSASPSAAPSVPQLEDDFEKVWNQYPNKKGKKQAFNHYKAWRRSSAKHTNEYLLRKLGQYKSYCARNSWYHPMNGSTWFNGRFDDELNTNSPAKKSDFNADEFFHDGPDMMEDVNTDDLPFQ